MEKKIKITFIGTLPPLMGVSEVCIGLINSLKGKVDFEFYSFKKLFPSFLHPAKKTMTDEPPIMDDKVKYTITYYNPFTWIMPSLKAKGDVIHLQWWTAFLFPFYFPMFLIAKARGKKTVLQVHNVLPHDAKVWDKWVSTVIYRLSDRLILHTERMKEILLEGMPKFKEKIRVIPYGPLSLYPDPPITQEEAKKELEIPAESRVALFFGNIRQYKGVETLLKGFKGVTEELKDARLIIAGRVWGPIDYWSEKIRDLSLQKNVLFMPGFVPNQKVGILFKAADVVVLPYKRFDSLSGVAMVALGFGKALVLSDVGSLREIAPDSKVLFKPEDPEDLKRALLLVLKDPEYKRKLEERAIQISSNFSWEKVTRELVKVYRELV